MPKRPARPSRGQTEAEAIRVAQKIRDYWLKRGRAVATKIERVCLHDGQTVYYSVRSDLKLKGHP